MFEIALTDTGFGADYEVEAADGAHADVEFSRPTAVGEEGLSYSVGAPPLIVRVATPSGESWVGAFSRGAEGLTAVHATPSADIVCVIARGDGYWVPVLAPTDFQMIPCVPVRQVLPIVARNVLVFGDYTTLAAYGPGGLLWLTPELSWDGIQIDEVTNESIAGTGWDAPAERRVPFTIDVASGRVEGGSSPASYGVGR